MPDVVAKGMAAIVAGLLAVAIIALVVTSRPAAGAQQVPAEFDSAFPLIEGMHVRVDGAIAGSVGKIEVNDRGNAVVNLVLHESIEPATANATAAIRQQDTTGDSYVAFDPGDSSEPLGNDGIVCTDWDTCPSTLVAPRLDDLLNAFGPGERAGIKLALVETAKALDRRGADLNGAALALKPGLESANEALAEVNSQNEALERLVESSEKATSQAAGNTDELGSLIDSLETTLSATAEEGEALDAGLEKLPETTRETNEMLAALDAAAGNTVPVARELSAGAPEFARAVEQLAPFVADASAWLDGNGPTLDLTRKLAKAARPSLEIAKKRVVTGSFDLVGATADLLNTTLGGEDAFPALFGDDSYGVGEGTLGKRGFGAVAVEPGNLPGYPADHAPRNWLRVSAVMNCEVFGQPVEPGCLTGLLSGFGLGSEQGSGKTRKKGAGKTRESAAKQPAQPAEAYAEPTPGASLLPDVKLPKIGGLDPNELLPSLGVPGLGEDDGKGRGGRRGKLLDETLGGVLDFLFKP